MNHPVYRFGDCRIDPVARELWRGEQLVALPPHVFDCLAYLVERHDRAVGRDELVAAVWGRTEVSDTLLGQTVLRIRRELGDDGKDPRILRTIPRFGYRWVAPLDASAAPEAAAAEPAATPAAGDRSLGADEISATLARPPEPLPQRTRPRVKTLLALFAVIAAGAAGAWFIAQPDARRGDGSGSSASVEIPESAAVLPAAVEPGAEWSWMRFGVMDVVATRLRSSGLPTVPSESLIVLLNAPTANRTGSLRDAAGFRLLVSPRASHRSDAWQVDLEADDGAGRRYAAAARARDVTVAAREAADRLLVAMGRQPPGAVGEAAPNEELLRRVDAAILADDPTRARGLIEQASAEQQGSAELRLRLAKIDFRGGRLDAARDRLQHLLDEAPAATAPVLRASLLNGIGAVAIRSDRPQQAEQAFGEAIGLLMGHPEPSQLGQAYLGRAGAAANQRRFEAAAADYARARIAFRQANDTLALIRVDANEGFLDLDQGRPAQALPQLVAAGEGFARWGALNEAVFAYIGQISCRLALLEPRKALDAADAAAALVERIDNPSTRDSLTIARAKALAAVGRLHEARQTLERLRAANPAADDVTAAAAAVPLARIELDAGAALAAADLATRAVTVLTDASYARLRADAWSTEVGALTRAKNQVTATARAAAFDAWAAAADDRRTRLLAQLARAGVARQFDGSAQWRGEFDSARKLAGDSGVPADIARVAAEYADALIGDGDLEAAAVEVGRVSRWSDRDFACAVLEARLYAALGRDEARQTALARARTLAGERPVPADAVAASVSAREASTH